MAISKDNFDEDDEEFEFEDGEFGDVFLSSELDENINFIQIPSFEFDQDEFAKGYLKMLRTCKTTPDALNTLNEMISQIRVLTIIETQCMDLQNRVLELEAMMKQVQLR